MHHHHHLALDNTLLADHENGPTIRGPLRTAPVTTFKSTYGCMSVYLYNVLYCCMCVCVAARLSA